MKDKHFIGNAIKNLLLGDNVEKIGRESLLNSGIENITISSNNPNYVVKDGAIYSKDGTILITPVNDAITSFQIPSGVKEIADFAFHLFQNLESVNISNTVNKIGTSFNYCNKLKTIEIPSNVTSISQHCFSNSKNLKEIIVHNKDLKGSPWGVPIGDKAIIWDN